jgi:ABC-type antimicrobial peptide transport system permease subunit
MGLRFLRIAVVYLVIGALLGLVMGITQTFVLTPVHAHLLLLGWASLALAGLVYHLYPAASSTWLARLHFWLHNIGLPVFMLGLGFLLTGSEWALPLVIGGAIAVLLGLVLFAANVLLNAKPVQAAA